MVYGEKAPLHLESYHRLPIDTLHVILFATFYQCAQKSKLAQNVRMKLALVWLSK